VNYFTFSIIIILMDAIKDLYQTPIAALCSTAQPTGPILDLGPFSRTALNRGGEGDLGKTGPPDPPEGSAVRPDPVSQLQSLRFSRAAKASKDICFAGFPTKTK